MARYTKRSWWETHMLNIMEKTQEEADRDAFYGILVFLAVFAALAGLS